MSKTHTGYAFPSQGAKLTAVQVPTPAVGPDDVLVRVVYVSPTPLDVWQGHFGLAAEYPLVPADNLYGVAAEVGEHVKHVAKGDKVLSFTFGPNEGRGSQQYALIPANRIAKLPANVDPVAAVTVPTNLVTVFHTITADLGLDIIRDASGKPLDLPADVKSKRILVWGGSSSVGQYAIQLLALSGYTNVITASSARHHADLLALGASRAVDYTAPTVLEDVGGPVDYVLDAIGDRQETIAKYSPLARPGARVAILLPIRYGGRAANNVGSELDEGAFAPGVHVRLVRTHFYEKNEWFRDHLQPELLPALLEKGLIKPNKIRVVEGSTPLERLQNAIDSLANGAVSGEKLVVRIGED
ncbi:GroES-like protein [Punctularia strigosozonata HHB-11173 SS5]|uniref:GroES-like protein n=1 Tax=Punctularia strigosozonata (strain HHB-11173) TaxID=741275 RepID=UPI00044165EF|nr:GroES-like protein [Punctularia strigosozonata HHB-11173 SS5]EIN13304.1 GroES-like protein [Punctularia strigosozonata HHB-11173 SS5]